MTPEAYRRGDVNLDFHSAIARASGNPALGQVILDLLGRFHETGFTDLPGPEAWTVLRAAPQPVAAALAPGTRGRANSDGHAAQAGVFLGGGTRTPGARARGSYIALRCRVPL